MVTEVDCTDENGEKICELFGITTFPTLMWGALHDLQDYTGGRSYENFSNFAKDNLKPMCSATNLDLCEPETKKLLGERLAMSETELQDLSLESLMEWDEINREYMAKMDELQKEFKELEKKRNDAIAAYRKEAFLPQMIAALLQMGESKHDEL